MFLRPTQAKRFDKLCVVLKIAKELRRKDRPENIAILRILFASLVTGHAHSTKEKVNKIAVYENCRYLLAKACLCLRRISRL